MFLPNKLSEHFTLDEFIRSRTAEKHGIRNYPNIQEYNAMKNLCDKVLEDVRSLLWVPLIITSGYRCKELNRKIGSKDSSQHVIGEAVDFVPKGMSVRKAAKKIAATNIPFDQLIFEQKVKDGNITEWIHISCAYNRRMVLNKLAGQDYRAGLDDAV